MGEEPKMRIKRLFDFILSIFVLLILMPFNILISFLIKHNSTGPVFFCQDRVGQDGKLFTMWKFRTMYSDTNPTADSPNSDSDIRITRIGKLLREYSFDEIPQLINILKGEMSLIGPRPIYLKLANRLSKEQKKRFSMKPGITGLAQIRGRTNLTWKERIEIDCYYVNNWSMILDVVIFFKTIIIMFFKKNIYEIDVSMEEHGIYNNKKNEE